MEIFVYKIFKFLKYKNFGKSSIKLKKIQKNVQKRNELS